MNKKITISLFVVITTLILLITSCIPAGYTVSGGKVVPSSTVYGSGNITTSGGTVGRVPYFTAAFNLENSGLFWNNLNNRLGINNVAPTTALDVTGTIHSSGDINSDQDINATNDLNAGNDLDVNDDADIGDDLTVHGDIIVTGTVDGVDVSTINNTDFVMQLIRRGNFMPYDITGYNNVNTGGGSSYNVANARTHDTSVTASSSALSYVAATLREVGWFVWDKQVIYSFGVARVNSDTEGVGRVQLKTPTAIGALADHGIGMRIDNYAITWESYGAAGLATTASGITMTNDYIYWIDMIFTPGVSVAYYVNGALNTTHVDTTKIPSASKATYLVTSIANGVTGGVNVRLRYISPLLWKAR